MRRRRQKNNLLPKMIGFAVLINAILLPILAQFGVFKSIGGSRRLTPIELVKAPPPEKRPAPPKKAKKQAAKPRPAGRKAAARSVTARRVPTGPPPVKVVAAGGPGSNGSGGDAGIVPSDSGPAAVTPPAPPVTLPPASPSPAPTPAPPAPTAAPPPVEPAAKPPPVPHVPTLTAAAPITQPHPVIPDDLRASDLNAAFEGLFLVRADGTATVKMVSSTGSPALDSLALDAARRWTFRPATRDGQPVESWLRLRIEFEVSS